MSHHHADASAIDAKELHQLLEGGGLAFETGDEATDSGASKQTALLKYSALRDPEGAERLATTLAKLVRRLDETPNLIVVWGDSEDAVLAHIVARELGIRSIRTWDADGLVAHSGSLPDTGARALLLTDVLHDATPVRALETFIEQHDGSVVGIAALVHTESAARANRRLVTLDVIPFPGNDGDQG